MPRLLTKVAMNWKEKLGDQIKSARQSLNLTQGELASRVHVSRPMISRYERGTDAPVINVLALLAIELDVKFEIPGIRIGFESISPRLRSMPKQLRIDFERPQLFPGAVISITPSEGQILITAKIPA
jgi:transcriptional regulator with XRE-family HTH domain